MRCRDGGGQEGAGPAARAIPAQPVCGVARVRLAGRGLAEAPGHLQHGNALAGLVLQTGQREGDIAG